MNLDINEISNTKFEFLSNTCTTVENQFKKRFYYSFIDVLFFNHSFSLNSQIKNGKYFTIIFIRKTITKFILYYFDSNAGYKNI